MKKRKVIVGVVILFLITIVNINFVYSAPSVNFSSQLPADISAFNIFFTSLNITYNISDANLNLSTIVIYHKTNSTLNDYFYFENGSVVSGYLIKNYTSNISSIFLFNLLNDEIYPASYNYNELTMESTNHSLYDLDTDTEYLKIRLFNVSNQKNYSFFEVYADNQTGSSNSLRMYYCNSSYNSGTPATSKSCTNFYNMLANQRFNHTHTNYSKHHVIPFPINSTLGSIGGIYVTNTSYFLLRGRLGVNAWNIYYINNVSRQDSIQFSTNNGGAWANLTGTIDAHIHQYSGKESFAYYACANDTSNNRNCTTERFDLIGLGGLGPSAPSIYSPTNQNYSKNIFINYTSAVSPNGYNIKEYNISLYNETDGYVSLIVANNSINLNYTWNSSGTTDGNYNVHVWGCDVNGLCALGESDDFIIDNTLPSFSSISASADSSTVTLTWVTNEPTNYTLHYGTTTSTTNSTSSNVFELSHSVRLTSLSSRSIYYYNISGSDSAGNLNTTVQHDFQTSEIPSSIGISEGGGLQKINIEPLTTEPKEIDISLKQRVSFMFDKEIHILRFVKLDTIKKEAVFEFSSKKQNVSIKENETAKIDLDNDNVFDLIIKLNKIRDNRAKIDLSLIGKEIMATNLIKTEVNDSLIDKSSIIEEDKSSLKIKGSFLSKIISFILILSIFVGIYYYKSQKDNI